MRRPPDFPEDIPVLRVETTMKTLLLLLGLSTLGACYGGHPKQVETHEEPGFLTVIALKYASALDVANTLNKLQKKSRVVADVRTNSLVVSYSSQLDLAVLTECIEKLDVEVKGAK